MRTILEAMKLLRRLADIGSKLAISDVGVGIQMSSAAMNGASLNVFINTKLMKDRAEAEKLNQEADSLTKQAALLTEETFQIVAAKVR
jgi:formiminotetrahydrofolate cyclodeaminase